MVGGRSGDGHKSSDDRVHARRCRGDRRFLLDANPVLVVGNTVDPSTPYQDSLAMSRDLARARLLTVDGYGHTAFLNPSSCAARYETRYLLTGALPPAGTVCRQDKAPFSPLRRG